MSRFSIAVSTVFLPEEQPSGLPAAPRTERCAQDKLVGAILPAGLLPGSKTIIARNHIEDNAGELGDSNRKNQPAGYIFGLPRIGGDVQCPRMHLYSCELLSWQAGIQN